MELLSTAWYLIIGFCIFMYVLLDGFDLGVGILFALFTKQDDRDVMISTILPVWDGNQTWLVLGGASLYGAFPLAFSLLLPALYLPIFLMILALLFRGITFEFRLKAKQALRFWDTLFFLSSTIATFCQGLVLGTFVKGYSIVQGQSTLAYQLFSPFNLTCSVSLIFGYSLLAATWVIAKTTGELQQKMYDVAYICLWAVSMGLMIVSIWTPFVDPVIAHIWFNPAYMYNLAILPFSTGCLILFSFYCLYKRREYMLFWLSVGIFLCGYTGFGISTWPYLIPRVITIWDAAAPDSSLLFMLIGAVILLPLLLGYTSYAYYIFRGKITEAIGYE